MGESTTFSESDLKMYDRFAVLIRDKAVFQEFTQREMAESRAVFLWYNGLRKKIEDHIMEVVASGPMDPEPPA